MGEIFKLIHTHTHTHFNSKILKKLVLKHVRTIFFFPSNVQEYVNDRKILFERWKSLEGF